MNEYNFINGSKKCLFVELYAEARVKPVWLKTIFII